MPKVDLSAIEATNRTGYPPPLNAAVAGRWHRRLGPALGLSDFGASDVTLQPGAWSSQRHWHDGEDELVVMLEGEAVLVDDGGRTLLKAGDIAAFPGGIANAHHLINESAATCRFLAIGGPERGPCLYPDVDLHLDDPDGPFHHKDGTAY